MIYTQSNDVVYITIADKWCDENELLKKIRSIGDKSMGRFDIYDFIEFPMVDLDERPNISWVENLIFRTESGPYQITRATQHTRFKMNRIGARVKSEVVMDMLYGANGSNMERGLIINRPFFIWIKRKGVTFPIFAAYVDTADWKNPGNLDMQ